MTTALSARTISIITALFISFILLAGTTIAAKPQGNTRPGWGFGDTNHVHLGPPGQSVNPTNSTIINNNINFSSNTGGNVSTGGSITTGVSQFFLSIINNIGV